MFVAGVPKESYDSFYQVSVSTLVSNTMPEE